MSIGEKIQQLRKTRGLSQEQLADRLNISRQAVSKWETDQSSPEIENILALSKEFAVSTDELLGNDTAENSETLPTPLNEEKRRYGSSRRAGRMFSFIDRKIGLQVFTVLCFIAVGVCVIVDYALNRQITWAAYPIISVPAGWLIFAPLIYRKYSISLCVLTVVVTPFLFLMDKITPGPDWFYGLGIPSAVIGIVFIWINYLIYRFTKINAWYKAAAAVFLASIVDLFTDFVINRYLAAEQSPFITIIQLFSCLVVAALLAIIGYVRDRVKLTESMS